MGRACDTVEDACLGQQVGSGANGTDGGAIPPGSTDPLEQRPLLS
jgi:hypothetical protein